MDLCDLRLYRDIVLALGGMMNKLQLWKMEYWCCFPSLTCLVDNVYHWLNYKRGREVDLSNRLCKRHDNIIGASWAGD